MIDNYWTYVVNDTDKTVCVKRMSELTYGEYGHCAANTATRASGWARRRANFLGYRYVKRADVIKNGGVKA